MYILTNIYIYIYKYLNQVWNMLFDEQIGFYFINTKHIYAANCSQSRLSEFFRKDYLSFINKWQNYFLIIVYCPYLLQIWNISYLYILCLKVVQQERHLSHGIKLNKRIYHNYEPVKIYQKFFSILNQRR